MDVLLAHQALAEPARLELAQALLTRDLSPGEVSEQWGLSTSLVAHHVKCLVEAGLISRRRSEHDARKSYLSLRSEDPQVIALVSVGTPMLVMPRRVAFVCTHNSARSKLAAACWRQISKVPAVDAGTIPAKSPHPWAIATADQRGLALDPEMHDVATTVRDDDLVIAVCDHAHELLDRWPDRFHWSIPDPVGVAPTTPDAFVSACDNIQTRVRRLYRSIRTNRNPS
jgi:ArsR family transcriptional regulator, arsenate/arsenite/antimonite-responsive transcriptional repressor / arsenate reductase (thioredoxin)